MCPCPVLPAPDHALSTRPAGPKKTEFLFRPRKGNRHAIQLEACHPPVPEGQSCGGQASWVGPAPVRRRTKAVPMGRIARLPFAETNTPPAKINRLGFCRDGAMDSSFSRESPPPCLPRFGKKLSAHTPCPGPNHAAGVRCFPGNRSRARSA